MSSRFPAAIMRGIQEREMLARALEEQSISQRQRRFWLRMAFMSLPGLAYFYFTGGLAFKEPPSLPENLLPRAGKEEILAAVNRQMGQTDKTMIGAGEQKATAAVAAGASSATAASPASAPAATSAQTAAAASAEGSEDALAELEARNSAMQSKVAQSHVQLNPAQMAAIMEKANREADVAGAAPAAAGAAPGSTPSSAPPSSEASFDEEAVNSPARLPAAQSPAVTASGGQPSGTWASNAPVDPYRTLSPIEITQRFPELSGTGKTASATYQKAAGNESAWLALAQPRPAPLTPSPGYQKVEKAPE